MSASRQPFARALKDPSGNVAIIFGLTIFVIFGMVGGAVDFGRWLSANNETQAAADSAVLAAGRVLQTSGGNESEAIAVARTYYNKLKSTKLVQDSTTFTAVDAGTAILAQGTGTMTTPFLNVFGIPTLPVAINARAVLAAGGNAEQSLEVSMMLDVTGSMAGQKIADLKVAAKDLIDIVVWDNQGEYTSKVALAPFAEAVNVGTALAPLVRGTVPTSGVGSSQANPFQLSMTDSVQPNHEWIRFFKPNKTSCNNSGCNTWRLSAKCVSERIGAQAYTDASPATAKVAKVYAGTDPNTSCTVANHADPEINVITPLTNDKTELKQRIDKLTIAGATAGQLGTAWAWYLLSPNWASVFPAASAPAAYGAPKLKKIAILMTDGDYNTEYCKAVEAKDSNSPKINCNSTNGASQTQAPQLCTAMKAGDKITVYTVGFQVSSAAATLLTNCATSPAHYYNATSGEELRAAFRDIALQISTLRLSM